MKVIRIHHWRRSSVSRYRQHLVSVVATGGERQADTSSVRVRHLCSFSTPTDVTVAICLGVPVQHCGRYLVPGAERDTFHHVNKKEHEFFISLLRMGMNSIDAISVLFAIREKDEG